MTALFNTPVSCHCCHTNQCAHCHLSTVSVVTLLPTLVIAATTLYSFSLPQRYVYISVKVAASDSTVTPLSAATAVTLINVHIVISALSVLYHCYQHWSLLPQCCARFHCHNDVLVFGITTLCTSVSNCCVIPPVCYYYYYYYYYYLLLLLLILIINIIT